MEGKNMESNYYLNIEYNNDYSIYGFGLFDKKRLRYYCGNNIIGEAFNNYDKNLNRLFENNKNKICIMINYKEFLKFKKLNFKKEISMKNLIEVLNQLEMEEYVI